MTVPRAEARVLWLSSPSAVIGIDAEEIEQIGEPVATDTASVPILTDLLDVPRDATRRLRTVDGRWFAAPNALEIGDVAPGDLLDLPPFLADAWPGIDVCGLVRRDDDLRLFLRLVPPETAE